jgi:hypothetical protein
MYWNYHQTGTQLVFFSTVNDTMGLHSHSSLYKIKVLTSTTLKTYSKFQNENQRLKATIRQQQLDISHYWQTTLHDTILLCWNWNSRKTELFWLNNCSDTRCWVMHTLCHKFIPFGHSVNTYLLKQQSSILTWINVYKHEQVYGLVWIPVCNRYIVCSVNICNQNNRKWITYQYTLHHSWSIHSFHNKHPHLENLMPQI